jgi:hypothetical protein
MRAAQNEAFISTNGTGGIPYTVIANFIFGAFTVIGYVYVHTVIMAGNKKGANQLSTAIAVGDEARYLQHP